MNIERQVDCSQQWPDNTKIKDCVVVTVPGNGAAIGDILSDDGTGVGKMKKVAELIGRCIPEKFERSKSDYDIPFNISIVDCPRPESEPNTAQDPDKWMDFKECSICAAQVGCITMCTSCQHNRSVIDRFQAICRKHAISYL